MNKARLEAFSDGVFAIVITLLILDIRLPTVPYEQLPQALKAAIPQLTAYVLSFLLIGLYWVFHHRGFHRIQRVDGVAIWLNILYLLFVSVLPFPTTLLGRYPLQTLPIVLYGACLVGANATGFLMLLYAHKRRVDLAPGVDERHFRQDWPIYAVVNGAYLLAIGIAFVSPLVSELIFSLVIVIIGWRTLTDQALSSAAAPLDGAGA